MPTPSDAELADANRRLEGRPPHEVLGWAATRFAPRLALATALGPEGCLLIDVIARDRLAVDVFTLDTGLFFPETYALWRDLERRYGIVIRGVEPAQTVAEQAAAHGEALWARDPGRCCHLRKVAPLERVLDGLDAWATSIRREQSPVRVEAGLVERDARFGLVKVNPLAHWRREEVGDYLRAHGVPTNPLHARGYPSVGCLPCTTPVAEGEEERAGRWRGFERRECGLHTRPAVAVSLSVPDQRKEPLPMTVSPDREPLVAPHGGTLVDRLAGPREAEDLRRRTEALPALTLDAREAADLELLGVGAFSPLTGFLGRDDYESVLERLRLADGTVWPLPVTLAVGDDARGRLGPGTDVALRDETGRLRGRLRVAEVFSREAGREARAVYGTDDPGHPGVAYLRQRPQWLLAGEVTVLPPPADLPFARYRLTPRALRAEIVRREWRTVAGFQTRNPIHRAHEHLTKLALEVADGLVLHPLVGETKDDDVPAAVRFKAYEALVSRYYPPGRTLLAAFPAAMRYAGPREALFHALVRKNYGITHLIVGRDHAGVGRYYGPYEAQAIFDRFSAEELGVQPLRLRPTFFCRVCDALASERTCPHDGAARLELSGTKVREILRAGGELPRQFTRPEVADVLRSFYSSTPHPVPPHPGGGDRLGADGPAPRSHGPHPAPGAGFIVWFTGLSGAGKSTLASALVRRLHGVRALEVLDGDEVRTHLSKGLGFSREDRDTNIRRIGFVARLLARHGAAVATAAISPYAAARDEVRREAAAEGIPFLEVYAKAPLDALVARDVKGLYRKALEGSLPHFTGVSDPYEAPANPEVVVETDGETVEESLARIVAALEERGLMPQAAPEALAS